MDYFEGCGEQNMLGMSPQVYVYQYLDSVGQLDDKKVTYFTIKIRIYFLFFFV